MPAEPLLVSAPQPAVTPSANPSRRLTTWPVGLVAAMLLGLVLRLLYAAAATKLPGSGGDDDWYHAVANLVADGHGFTLPFVVAGGDHLVPNLGHGPPTAFHPPLFPLLLAGVSKLGADSFDAHQVTGCVLGALTVGGVGLVARRIAGDRAGVLAACVAALSLPLIVNDSLLMSESLSGLTIVGVLLAALALLRRPTAGRALVLGAAIGLAALTRGEALLLLPLLAVPVARRAGSGASARFGLVVLASVVVVGPWTIRNAIQFDRLVPITTGDGTVVAGANAPSTYHGPLTGFWDIQVLFAVQGRRSSNEAVAGGQYRRQGLDYARDHLGRLPFVAGVRVLRTWGLWNPRQQRDIASVVNGHVRRLEWLTFVVYLATLGLALGGAWVARRRGLGLAWLLVPAVVLVTISSVLGYGAVRFREPADISLVVLAGMALDVLAGRVLGGARARSAAT